ncbi:MFS transporter [Falcatimonas sp. MSJ-15]|uniref:MFS transporter n=1 Tax=Falcatimonas sp. MSJ-15 TaxID=2841515 RepID=UPI001C108E1F|nr:MFS transporter [Falcatimonas sp. MSJ-15]MBU5470977.1 MFS transporter [Falcatimonas sp. MSJ-15]
MKFNYKTTMYACFTGYIVQAIVNSFVPLLFVTFQKSYNIPLSKITLLITVNFAIQLIIDMLSAGFIDRIGYRASVIIAHICAVMGLGMLTFLPEIFEDHFTGIIISVVIYAIGGGLIEVLISPIIEACPTDNKESTMSLLHSFYCWGCTGVVLVSTIFFKIFGIENWKILTLILLIIPVVNIILFAKVPIYSLHEEGECGFTMRELFREKIFWILMLMMLCAGASEQAVSQWASTFAEQGLGVSKALGDLIGPMLFSVLMGISRLIYGRYGERMDLDRFMRYSTILCIISYMCISLIRVPIIELIACGICGFSVGIMWPGTFSKASASIRRGGTVMFAMLALAGDLGCSGGPTLVGMVSSALDNNLRIGILSGIIFPVILIITLIIIKKVSVNNRLERES